MGGGTESLVLPCIKIERFMYLDAQKIHYMTILPLATVLKPFAYL
jgi:hypothetical protein